MVLRVKASWNCFIECLKSIAQQGSRFIIDSCRVLAYPHAVQNILYKVINANKSFHVYVTDLNIEFVMNEKGSTKVMTHNNLFINAK